MKGGSWTAATGDRRADTASAAAGAPSAIGVAAAPASATPNASARLAAAWGGFFD